MRSQKQKEERMRLRTGMSGSVEVENIEATKETDMEDFLLEQIDEFREKAKQLQELINTKETKVKELQELVDERESKATELKQELDERQKEADSLVGNVENQVDKLIQKIETQQNENQEELKKTVSSMEEDMNKAITGLEEDMKKTTGQMQEELANLTKSLKTVKEDLSEKIHTEDVKCYRNIRGLLDEVSEKLESVEMADGRIRYLKRLFGWTITLLIINFAGIVMAILSALRIITL